MEGGACEPILFNSTYCNSSLLKDALYGFIEPYGFIIFSLEIKQLRLEYIYISSRRVRLPPVKWGGMAVRKFCTKLKNSFVFQLRVKGVSCATRDGAFRKTGGVTATWTAATKPTNRTAAVHKVSPPFLNASRANQKGFTDPKLDHSYRCPLAWRHSAINHKAD